MPEPLDLSALTPTSEPMLLSQEPVSSTLSEVAPTSPATSQKGGTNSPLPLWQPAGPQFTKAIAAYYGVSRKSVQQWFQKVKEACPWFTEVDLKLPDERYTPLCIELMGHYRTSGLPFEAWKTQVWEQNPDLVAVYQASQAATEAKRIPETCALTLRESDVSLPVQSIQPLQLTVVDSTQRLAEAISDLNVTLQQFVSNDRTLEEALRQNAAQKGTRLGTELAIAEIGSMMQSTESVRTELAKKLGLLSTAADSSQPQSA